MAEKIFSDEALAVRDEAFGREPTEDLRKRRIAGDLITDPGDQAFKLLDQHGPVIVRLGLDKVTALPGCGHVTGAITLRTPLFELHPRRPTAAVDPKCAQLRTHVEDVECDAGKLIISELIAYVDEPSEAVTQIQGRATVEILPEPFGRELDGALGNGPTVESRWRREELAKIRSRGCRNLRWSSCARQRQNRGAQEKTSEHRRL
jgi:hypothetical protein